MRTNITFLKHASINNPCGILSNLVSHHWFIEPRQSGSSEGGDERINTSESETLQEVWKFCKSQSKNVEVLYENMNGRKILTRIHFRFDPHVTISITILL